MPRARMLAGAQGTRKPRDALLLPGQAAAAARRAVVEDLEAKAFHCRAFADGPLCGHEACLPKPRFTV